jgi:hypothetical protein
MGRVQTGGTTVTNQARIGNVGIPFDKGRAVRMIGDSCTCGRPCSVAGWSEGIASISIVAISVLETVPGERSKWDDWSRLSLSEPPIEHVNHTCHSQTHIKMAHSKNTSHQHIYYQHTTRHESRIGMRTAAQWEAGAPFITVVS